MFLLPLGTPVALPVSVSLPFARESFLRVFPVCLPVSLRRFFRRSTSYPFAFAFTLGLGGSLVFELVRATIASRAAPVRLQQSLAKSKARKGNFIVSREVRWRNQRISVSLTNVSVTARAWTHPRSRRVKEGLSTLWSSPSGWFRTVLWFARISLSCPPSLKRSWKSVRRLFQGRWDESRDWRRANEKIPI